MAGRGFVGQRQQHRRELGRGVGGNQRPDACGRSLADALPFFSKVNALRTAEDLANRGFKVAFARIDTSPVLKA